MIGEKGVVAYKAIVMMNGQPVAEGRGASSVAEKTGKSYDNQPGRVDYNAVVKIAEKRARMDACLSLGFSEFFTQDLEDGGFATEIPAETKTERKPVNHPVTDSGKPASDKQKNLIGDLMEKKDVTLPALQKMLLNKLTGKETRADLTSTEADKTIKFLLSAKHEEIATLLIDLDDK
jgi:hypothetical protein